jgi:hypothetical protein
MDHLKAAGIMRLKNSDGIAGTTTRASITGQAAGGLRSLSTPHRLASEAYGEKTQNVSAAIPEPSHTK